MIPLQSSVEASSKTMQNITVEIMTTLNSLKRKIEGFSGSLVPVIYCELKRGIGQTKCEFARVKVSATSRTVCARIALVFVVFMKNPIHYTFFGSLIIP